MIYLAVERYCDAEDPFWSDCKILGAFNKRKDAEEACAKAKEAMLNDDPDSYVEICKSDLNNKQLYAIRTTVTMTDWRIEKIKEVK